MILGALAGAAFLFITAKSFESAASLWIDTAPPLASSVGAELSPPLSEPPATAEQGILSELLTTQTFAASVANSSLLGKYLGNAASIQKNAPTYLEDGQVVPTVTGEQVLKITYSGSSAAIAESVLGAIVTQLQSYNDRLTAQHNQATVAYDREQVKIAKAALATARSNVNAYLAGNPHATQADPNLLSLAAAESNAVTQLGQANSTLSEATDTRDAGGWTIQVVDPPSQPVAPAQGKKKMLEMILGGAFGGLLLSFLIVVAITPAKKDMWEDELAIGKPFVPGVPPADPFSVQSPPMPAELGQDGNWLSPGERRFAFRSQSEQLDER